MRRIVAATSAALAATGFALMPASPAAAAVNHSVNISGTMFILDDENWPQSDQRATVNFNHSVVVGSNIGQTTWTARGCAGGEVRVEVLFTIAHTSDAADRVRVTPRIRLYEGTSCSSNDLDGTLNPVAFTVAANSASSQTYQVRNTAEGGDRADIQVTVSNQV